jgi:hypothetical protein
MQPGADLFKGYGDQEFDSWRQAMRRHLRQGPADERVVLYCWRQGAPAFPPVCPNCMAPAAGQLQLERVYKFLVEDSDGGSRRQYLVDELKLPICAPCLERHRAEARPPGGWAAVQRLLGFEEGGLGIGGLLLFCGGLFLFQKGLTRLDYWLPLFASAPLLIGYFMMRAQWRQSAYRMVPADTSVSLSVETTPGLALDGEPPWQAYRFRLPFYAARFRELNQAALWDPHCAEAQAARAQRRAATRRTNWIIGTIMVAVLLWGLWDEYVKPLLNP